VRARSAAARSASISASAARIFSARASGSAKSSGGSSPRLSPCSASSAVSVRCASARIVSTCPRSHAPVRLASTDAFAAILVPSMAIVPNRPNPAFAASRSTCTNRSANAVWWACRKRAITEWSGTSAAQITRNATSTSHSRSICRDERTPRQ
jgi:hypothetical protein